MIESLKSILAKQAPDLLARTKLPRKDPNYLTQRQAFDIHRSRRFDDLAQHAPDLVARLNLPRDHPEHLDTPRAYAIWRGRKKIIDGLAANESESGTQTGDREKLSR
jgi:hypothetical protein